jgi:ankyrin repeat protein
MGFTALHRAAAYGFLDICKDLVERAPALVNIRTLSGDSALDIALRAGNRAKAVTAYLQQVGKRRSVCGVVWCGGGFVCLIPSSLCHD